MSKANGIHTCCLRSSLEDAFLCFLAGFLLSDFQNKVHKSGCDKLSAMFRLPFIFIALLCPFFEIRAVIDFVPVIIQFSLVGISKFFL